MLVDLYGHWVCLGLSKPRLSLKCQLRFPICFRAICRDNQYATLVISSPAPTRIRSNSNFGPKWKQFSVTTIKDSKLSKSSDNIQRTYGFKVRAFFHDTNLSFSSLEHLAVINNNLPMTIDKPSIHVFGG